MIGRGRRFLLQRYNGAPAGSGLFPTVGTTVRFRAEFITDAEHFVDIELRIFGFAHFKRENRGIARGCGFPVACPCLALIGLYHRCDEVSTALDRSRSASTKSGPRGPLLRPSRTLPQPTSLAAEGRAQGRKRTPQIKRGRQEVCALRLQTASCFFPTWSIGVWRRFVLLGPAARGLT